MVLRSDRVQEMVDRLMDPSVPLSDDDRELMSWVLYQSWALVEWKVLQLRGEPDVAGTNRLWQESSFEFFDRVEKGQGPEVFGDPVT